MHYNYYNRSLKPFARENRNNSTKAEIRMWCELLRNKKMLGYPFLRQRPVSDYIADFMCKELKLIIEIDGGYHNDRYEQDLVRTQNLNELGFTVLRFTNEEVQNQIVNVERAIVQWIEGRKARPTIPLPPSPAQLPSHKGDGSEIDISAR